MQGNAGFACVDGLAETAERAGAGIEAVGEGFAGFGLELELRVDVAVEEVLVRANWRSGKDILHRGYRVGAGR